ncbi:MAG TPA: DoxX family protein [Corynebacteriales bacterium]|nr:DoxX family protein [Mycobacteriales bacterium]
MTVEEELINGNNSPAVRPWVTALSLIARLVLAGVWIVSGATKVGDHLQTVVAVKAYAVVPEVMVEPIAYMLPTLEILLGVFLLLGIKNRWMAIASALVFTLFIIMIIQAWARGFQIDCGCFGGGGYDPTANAITYLTEIARDLIFMVFAVWLACFPKTPLALDPSSRAVLTVRKKDN